MHLQKISMWVKSLILDSNAAQSAFLTRMDTVSPRSCYLLFCESVCGDTTVGESLRKHMEAT